MLVHGADIHAGFGIVTKLLAVEQPAQRMIRRQKRRHVRLYAARDQGAVGVHGAEAPIGHCGGGLAGGVHFVLFEQGNNLTGLGDIAGRSSRTAVMTPH
jgi:hypothetical protein